MERRLEGERHRLHLAASQLDAMSPLKRLGGGYAFVADEKGRGVLSAFQVHEGERLRVHVRDGSFAVRVEEDREEKAQITDGSDNGKMDKVRDKNQNKDKNLNIDGNLNTDGNMN